MGKISVAVCVAIFFIALLFSDAAGLHEQARIICLVLPPVILFYMLYKGAERQAHRNMRDVRRVLSSPDCWMTSREIKDAIALMRYQQALEAGTEKQVLATKVVTSCRKYAPYQKSIDSGLERFAQSGTVTSRLRQGLRPEDLEAHGGHHPREWSLRQSGPPPLSGTHIEIRKKKAAVPPGTA
jgi:hypothetical protein